MNKLKSIITIIAISLATTFSTTATEKTTSKTNKKLRTEIVSILGDKIPMEIKKTTKAEVSFIINDKNEIVVVSVDCESKEFNSFVKNKLNYKKINATGVKKGEIYIMPIKINKK